ncbi:MAG: LamG domain-containing protein, partial [Planctomycetota bacterium]
PLVSKWSPLSSFNTFDAYDAGNTDGLKSIGYFGAVFDGRYVYFSPQRYGHEKDSAHGIALRYDTQKDFKDKRSWAAYDAGNTDNLNTKAHYGAVFDGRYVYFVPRGKNYGGETGTFNEFQSNLLRYDTHMDFKSSESWAAYDMGVNISKQSAAFDGRYIYFCPGFEHTPNNEIVGSSKVIRFDTEAGFKNPSSYRVLDVSAFSDSETGNYDGAAFDGRYIYFVPLYSGVVLRYDTKGDYGDKESWSTYDAKPKGIQMNVGAVFDGRYLYFAAYGNSILVKYDTYSDFSDDDSWSSYNAGNTKGLDTGGFDGGIFDGRYIYFIPFVSPKKDKGGYNFHTNFLRYDTQGQFEAPESWNAYDASNIDNLATIGYNGGAFDGRYLYAAPWQDRTDGKFGIHGNVLRYDTLGNDGSFSLRYCDYGHNGGLCAAVTGPSFIVNTEKGPISVSANKVLLPGWHHIAGVYNGSDVKLFVDGVLVAERTGAGLIQNNNVKVEIGRIQKGAARFNGSIDEVRISNIARNDDWIKTEYLNLINPAGFIRLGEEDTDLK